MTVPLRAIAASRVELLAGKVVIDTNYHPDRDGRFRKLNNGTATQSGQHLGTAKVVKPLTTSTSEAPGDPFRPAQAADRTALPVAGDDEAAKATVKAFSRCNWLRRGRYRRPFRKLAL